MSKGTIANTTPSESLELIVARLGKADLNLATKNDFNFYT